MGNRNRSLRTSHSTRSTDSRGQARISGYPPGEEAGLLEAARFMDANECNTVIAAARNSHGLTSEQLLQQLDAAGHSFREAARKQFGKTGEW